MMAAFMHHENRIPSAHFSTECMEPIHSTLASTSVPGYLICAFSVRGYSGIPLVRIIFTNVTWRASRPSGFEIHLTRLTDGCDWRLARLLGPSTAMQARVLWSDLVTSPISTTALLCRLHSSVVSRLWLQEDDCQAHTLGMRIAGSAHHHLRDFG